MGKRENLARSAATNQYFLDQLLTNLQRDPIPEGQQGLLDQMLGPIGNVGGLAERLVSGGGGLTEDEQQLIFDKARTRFVTPTEARLRRTGFESLGGQNILAGQERELSEGLAINEAQNRRSDIMNAIGASTQQFDLLDRLFGTQRQAETLDPLNARLGMLPAGQSYLQNYQAKEASGRGGFGQFLGAVAGSANPASRLTSFLR
jgi:hypothetical protein